MLVLTIHFLVIHIRHSIIAENLDKVISSVLAVAVGHDAVAEVLHLAQAQPHLSLGLRRQGVRQAHSTNIF